MRNYIKLFLGVCCSVSLFVSCSNDMDETVYSSITEQTYNYTTEDFQPAVASVYNYLRSSQIIGDILQRKKLVRMLL